MMILASSRRRRLAITAQFGCRPFCLNSAHASALYWLYERETGKPVPVAISAARSATPRANRKWFVLSVVDNWPNATGLGDLVWIDSLTMTASPKRRWFSFTLRTMFVVVTMLAIPLGWLVWQMQIVRERKAILVEVQRTDPNHFRYVWIERNSMYSGDSTNPFGGFGTQYDYARMGALRGISATSHASSWTCQPRWKQTGLNVPKIAFPKPSYSFMD